MPGKVDGESYARRQWGLGKEILLLGSTQGKSTGYNPSAGGAVLGIIPNFVSKQQENLFLRMFLGDTLQT